jgi:hypothetical protein
MKLFNYKLDSNHKILSNCTLKLGFVTELSFSPHKIRSIVAIPKLISFKAKKESLAKNCNQ